MSSLSESMNTMDIDDDGGSSMRVPIKNMDLQLPIDPRLFQTADEPIIFSEDEETEVRFFLSPSFLCPLNFFLILTDHIHEFTKS